MLKLGCEGGGVWMDTDALQRSTHMYPNKKQSARKGSICCQNEFVQIFFD